jgi:hypothetical protein
MFSSLGGSVDVRVARLFYGKTLSVARKIHGIQMCRCDKNRIGESWLLQTRLRLVDPPLDEVFHVGNLFLHPADTEIDGIWVMENERADAGFRGHHETFGEFDADFFRAQ